MLRLPSHRRGAVIRKGSLFTPLRLLACVTVLVLVWQSLAVWHVFFHNHHKHPQPLAVPRTKNILHDTYITLWLHQFHRWFGDESQRMAGVATFIAQAKAAGFGAVMTDLPWEWTEREAAGKYDITSFQKDWMAQVCQAGLKLHVVLTMRELPPWMERQQAYMEATASTCVGETVMAQPSSAHPYIWQRMQAYIGNTTQLLVERYGQDCLASISPTMNNEFETRFTQTRDHMRDYSPGALEEYATWRAQHQLPPSNTPPPDMQCNNPVCRAMTQPQELAWMAFREDFLAQRYISLCTIVKQATDSRSTNCLLHMGEMLATADHLNSNLLVQLATSDVVDDIVMDSNMMLWGSPTSPSVVGIMTSVARTYPHKRIHYELATERALPCNDETGQLAKPNNVMDPNRGATLLIRSGVLHALQASVHSLGVTNLCQPQRAPMILPLDPQNALYTARSFTPTAVIFVPHRVFYAYKTAILGSTCGFKSAPKCWHKSFAEITGFAHGANLHRKRGTCVVDAAQGTVLDAWDDLRSRHAQVSIVIDVQQLEIVASKATERVLIRYPCVMQDKEWKIWQGQEVKQAFEAIDRKYPFTERRNTHLC